jgi:hypothetical protein
MDTAEIRRHISEGADFSLRLLGDAEHMEYTRHEAYSTIRPHNGEEGGSSIFELRLEQYSDDELEQKVSEIMAMGMHVWWGAFPSERLLEAIWKGRQRPQATPDSDNGEAYMALLPEGKPEYEKIKSPITVQKVDSADAFKMWANLHNRILYDGYTILHPEKHYHLCEKGKLLCYTGYYDQVPAAIAAIMDNGGISSLESVATLADYRQKGLAKAVCSAAIEDAFLNGSMVITTRAVSEVKNLCRSLGFKSY